jgi:hypothetical protein
MQALYKCKQDKHPYIYDYTCNYNYDYLAVYPLYKYLLKYSPEAYILKTLCASS